MTEPALYGTLILLLPNIELHPRVAKREENTMKDFEKLGVFYLGKEYDLESKEFQEAPVLLKHASNDVFRASF